MRETGDTGRAWSSPQQSGAWSSPQQSGTGPATTALVTAPVSRRRRGKAACVQRGRRRACADAVRRPPYGDKIYPPGDVLCSRGRTPTLRLASEPESRWSRLAPLSRRQREDATCRRGSRWPQGTEQRADYSMLGAVLQSQAGDGEPSGGHRGIESASADDLAAVALDAQRVTSTSTVGLGVDVVARTAGYLFSRTPWSYSTALGCCALLDR